jgi:hypothetical protein
VVVGPSNGVNVGNQVNPLQKPWVVPGSTIVPPVLPQPTPSQEPKVEYFHLTTDESATDIVFNGVQPAAGGSSGNDPRFFAFTLAPRYSPPTTVSQLGDMMDALARQLDIRYPGADLSMVHVVLPEKVVSSLERSGQLHYGPFFRYSGPGYTESVFEVSSFSTINRYRGSWQIYSYP